MRNVRDEQREIAFHEHDLITWHYPDGNKQIPVPGVVIRRDAESVTIKTRVHDKFEEFHVQPEQLITR